MRFSANPIYYKTFFSILHLFEEAEEVVVFHLYQESFLFFEVLWVVGVFFSFVLVAKMGSVFLFLLQLLRDNNPKANSILSRIANFSFNSFIFLSYFKYGLMAIKMFEAAIIIAQSQGRTFQIAHAETLDKEVIAKNKFMKVLLFWYLSIIKPI